MTQEQKDLLLKDLSVRLPYGVKISIPDLWSQNREVEILDEIFKGDDGLWRVNSKGQCIEYIKPYLFPLSSISDDQKYDFHCIFIKNDCNFDDFKKFLYNGMWRRKLLTFTSLYDIEAIIDWFHKNHIDYRDLIPMGLAIDATNLNIY